MGRPYRHWLRVPAESIQLLVDMGPGEDGTLDLGLQRMVELAAAAEDLGALPLLSQSPGSAENLCEPAVPRRREA